MFIIECDSNLITNIIFAKTAEEAMEKFDRMTLLFNAVEQEEYLTCAEMDIFTVKDFLKRVVNGGTDRIWCYTLESISKSADECFEMDWKKFKNNS